VNRKDQPRRPGGRTDHHGGHRPSTLHRHAGNGTTATLTLDGEEYVVSGDLAIALRETLKPYIAVARRTGS
jgi:hypothetical protein